MQEHAHEYLAKVAAFVIVTMLFNLSYKPAFTIAYIYFGIAVLYDVYKNKTFRGFCIKRELLWGIGIYYGACLVAAICVGKLIDILEVKDLVTFMAPLFMLGYLANITDIKKPILWGLALVTFANAALMGYSHYKLAIRRPDGLLGNPNNSASFIGMLLPLVLYYSYINFRDRNYKDIVLPFLLIVATGIIIRCAVCRGVNLAIAIAALIFFLCWLYKKNKLLLLLSIALAAYLVYAYKGNILALISRKNSDMERICIYRSAWQMWLDNPFCGVGFASWPEIYQTQYILKEAHEPYIFHSHNVYLHILSSAGVVGLLGFLAFLFTQVKFHVKQIFAGSLWHYAGLAFIMIFALHGLVDAELFIKYQARVFWMMVFVYQYDKMEDR